MARTFSRGIQYLFTRIAAPPARARKDPATKIAEILDPLKNEAAKTAEFVIAQPDKICQKIGIAALEVGKRTCQYTGTCGQDSCSTSTERKRY
jgi:hypothetical protein